MIKITLYLAAVFLLDYSTLLHAKQSDSIVDEIQEGIDNLKAIIGASIKDGSELIATTVKENNKDAINFLGLYKDDVYRRIDDKEQEIAKWVDLASSQGITVEECIGNMQELGVVAVDKSQECAAVYRDDVDMFTRKITEEYTKFSDVITELKLELERCGREEESLPCLDALLKDVKRKNVAVPKEISDKTEKAVKDIQVTNTILKFCIATYSDDHFIADSDKLLKETVQCIQNKLE